MRIVKACQILKALSDSTRLRILNLLKEKELTVNEICRVLRKRQPNVSKHLTRMRLSGLVSSRKEGNSRYYLLSEKVPDEQKDLIAAVLTTLSQAEMLVRDRQSI
jgi:ArsR family transcriptional regulator